MKYKVKAVQYIRIKSDTGRWKAVDSITLLADYEFDVPPSEKDLRNVARRDVRKLLGRNWVMADIYSVV